MTANEDMNHGTPSDIAETYKIPDHPLYTVGTYDNGVTVLSQQVRALNLVYGLVECGFVPVTHAGKPAPDKVQRKIAIIGGGFAGLTVAAGLLAKGVQADIVVFEQRDTLLPLQQGSDTRWLHPHIYNWPAEGSEISAANLPLLTWTAARASDVVVQVLSAWNTLIEKIKNPRIELFCNTRHLQIHEAAAPKKLTIEWIGEKREPRSGNVAEGSTGGSTGQTCDFDVVITATGFGIETASRFSYWRNDMVGQPNLEQPRLTFLLSGQGDGAMIDLLRLRISHFRQDRILSELFGHNDLLLEQIREIKKKDEEGRESETFQSLEKLSLDMKDAFDEVSRRLSSRLRRDTDVILRLKKPKLSDLFDGGVRISFQNRVLVYALYKSGGFVPSTEKETVLVRQHAIPPERVIRRHGTKREMQLKNILSDSLFATLGSRNREKFRQTDEPSWDGGYFGFTGRLGDTQDAGDDIRRQWRKEYLPGATALVAATFCAAVASFLSSSHPTGQRLRVTFHRAVSFGREEVLQQCCKYFGVDVDEGGESPAGRTFPADNATIGLAYKTHAVIRSRKGIEAEELAAAMQFLNLSQASRSMAPDVRFVAALPMLASEDAHGRNPVIGVLYIDSRADDFFLDGDRLQVVLNMMEGFAGNLDRNALRDVDHISNRELARAPSKWHTAVEIPEEVRHALETVPVPLARMRADSQFNLEYSDFIPVGEKQ
ncbi:FAD-dependent oxidoreductase (plasmid) [Rhizobium sp. WSM1274]|uniref:FAD-dependent oxidoreductase n=1 Tax=Rhizobium sp. WSM1274 TaxID=3138254 RepID=UPI0021A4BDC2|nr:FAD-dependent oxidoreductase [Rhizobium leguminosarum]UWU31668.1 FAD-dependent oxidoreductase [Rhizobium leguminosarum bv. viciae]